MAPVSAGLAMALLVTTVTVTVAGAGAGAGAARAGTGPVVFRQPAWGYSFGQRGARLPVLFEPPIARCPLGSKMDNEGRCRPEQFQKFHNTLLADINDTDTDTDTDQTHNDDGGLPTTVSSGTAGAVVPQPTTPATATPSTATPATATPATATPAPTTPATATPATATQAPTTQAPTTPATTPVSTTTLLDSKPEPEQPDTDQTRRTTSVNGGGRPEPQVAAAPEPPPPVTASRPASRPSSSGIVFPDQPSPTAPLGGGGFVPECDDVPYMARNADTDRCQFLMLQTSCADGEWFILDVDTRQPACRPRPCPSGKVLHDGQCRPKDAVCPRGMEVLVDEYGRAGCDCAARHVYWPRRDRCYPAYRQGPCHVGQHLTLAAGGGGGRCTANPCVRDGTAFWPQTRRCYQLRDAADSPCEFSRLDVDAETLRLECVPTQLNALFDLAVVRCSPGSKMDYQGHCRQDLFQKFRSTLLADIDGRAAKPGGCPLGFLKAPSGRCLKAAPKRPADGDVVAPP